MSVFPHVIIGAGVGYFMPNIPASIGGGYLSHLILDFLPHWDPNIQGRLPTWRKLAYLILFIIDLSLGLGLLLLLKDYPMMLVGGFVGAFTDVDNFFHFSERVGIKTHVNGSGWQTQVGFIPGLASQEAVTLLGLYFIYTTVLSKILPLPLIH